MTLALRNPELLPALHPFVIAAPDSWERLDRQPFGLAGVEWFNPLRRDTTPLLNLLKRLDELTFGPEGMPMPQWMYLNSVTLSGAIVGFGAPLAETPLRLRELLDVPSDYRGLVPYAVYMAIPTSEDGVWFGHNLASLRAHVPEQNLHGLAGLTKAVALKMMRARAQIGATQWDSRALFVHVRLAPLELLTAFTPAHGDDPTLTYRAHLSDDSLLRLAGAETAPAVTTTTNGAIEWVASDDRIRHESLQREIETGARFMVAGRPETAERRLMVPVARFE